MYKKTVSLLLTLLLISSFISGCGTGTRSAYKKYSYEFMNTFDTVIQVMGYTKTEAEFDAWAEKASARFEELHKLYDMYNDYSGVNNIKTINDNAGKSPVKVAPEIISLIVDSKEWFSRSPGVVNVAMGAPLALWHDYRDRGTEDPANAQLPPMEDLKKAQEHTDINKVIVDKEQGTVYLEDEEMRLDVGAVAKGYATEIVARELEAQGWQSFIISSGGNVRAVGKPLDGVRSKWGVGIADPDKPGAGTSGDVVLDTAFVADLSVVTSGDYQRYYTVDGKMYNHIIDPVTLMPATNFRSVSIIVKDSGFADFLSTTLFILPYEQGLEYIKGLGNVEAMWVLPDGTIKVTDGMKSTLKKLGGATSK